MEVLIWILLPLIFRMYKNLATWSLPLPLTIDGILLFKLLWKMVAKELNDKRSNMLHILRILCKRRIYYSNEFWLFSMCFRCSHSLSNNNIDISQKQTCGYSVEPIVENEEVNRIHIIKKMCGVNKCRSGAHRIRTYRWIIPHLTKYVCFSTLFTTNSPLYIKTFLFHLKLSIAIIIIIII